MLTAPCRRLTVGYSAIVGHIRTEKFSFVWNTPDALECISTIGGGTSDITIGPPDADQAGARPIGVNLSGSRRSAPALHLFKGVQTETVRLHFDASASSASLKLTLMGALSYLHHCAGSAERISTRVNRCAGRASQQLGATALYGPGG